MTHSSTRPNPAALPSRLVLYDPFEVAGRWWLPERPDRTVSGLLEYSSDEILLILAGELGGPGSQLEGIISSSDVGRAPVIHGFTDCGKKLTLLKAVEVDSRSHNVQDPVRVVYSALYILSGYHSKSVDELSINSLEIGFAHLNSFVNARVVNSERQASDQIVRTVTMRYEAPEKRILRIRSLNADVELDTDFNATERQMAFHLDATMLLRLKPDAPQSLEGYFVVHLWRLCYLLSLLTGERVSPQWMRVGVAESESEHWLLYRAVTPQDSQPTVGSGLLLFYYAHIVDRLDEICERWFSVSDTLLSAMYLFMNALRQSGTDPRPRFLATTQAIEAFSRATTDSKYMPADDYEKLVERVLEDAIPACVTRDHRNSLKTRIKYGYEHSQRKQLQGLMNSLQPEMQECICRSVGEFVSGAIDTRNYLTHYTEALRKHALQGVELAWATEKLLMLLRVLFLRYLGIDEALIVRRITEHPVFRYERWQWRRFSEQIS